MVMSKFQDGMQLICTIENIPAPVAPVTINFIIEVLEGEEASFASSSCNSSPRVGWNSLFHWYPMNIAPRSTAAVSKKRENVRPARMSFLIP